MADLTVRAQGRKMCFVFTGWESNRTALEKSRIFGNPQPASLCACRTEKCTLFSPGGEEHNRENKAAFFESRSRLHCALQSSRLRLSKNAALFSRLRLNTTVKIKPHFSKAVAGLTARCSQAGYGFRKMRLYFHGCVSFPHATRLKQSRFFQHTDTHAPAHDTCACACACTCTCTCACACTCVCACTCTCTPWIRNV